MMASSTSSPSDKINAPNEILCSPTSNSDMNKNVAASTKGMASATTKPVRMPRVKKVTASTITTASANERTNSRTLALTARG